MSALGLAFLAQAGGDSSVVTVSSSPSDDAMVTVVVLVVCWGVGGVLLAFGLLRLRASRRLQARGRRATATVLGTGLGTELGVQPRQQVLYRFQTEDGQVVDLPTLGARFGPHAPGETATVLYDPAEPGVAVLDQFGWVTLPWLTFVVCGLFLVAFGPLIVAIT